MDDSGTRIWTKAVALTAVFLLGGALGWVVGRPSHQPAATLSPGEVRVPELSGLSAPDARRVLEEVGLRVHTVRVEESGQHPDGIVIAQEPPADRTVHQTDPVDLVVSSGPGPPPGSRYVFAESVLIPIDHIGTYRWTSTQVALTGTPVSFGANIRVIGDATVSPYRIALVPGGATSGMTVTFEVRRFRDPAWFVILRAYARQRESSTTR